MAKANKSILRSTQIKNSIIFVVITLLISSLQFGVNLTNFGPLTGPDPEMTISGSYALITGQSLSDAEDRRQEIAGNVANVHVQKISLPKNLVFDENIYHKDLVTTLLTSQISQAPGTYTIPSDEKLESQRENLVDEVKSTSVEPTYTRANQYTPISYLSTAVGMAAASLFSPISWDLLLGARISNFAIYMLLVLTSIVLTPRAKGIFTTVACLPPAIFCASSLSIDALLIGVALLYTAWALKLEENSRQLSIVQMLGVGTLTLLLLMLKVPYAPLALLYLALPKHIWPNKSKFITAAITLVLFAIIYGLWSANYQMVYTIPAIDYSSQVASIFSNLPKALLVCLANALFFIAITVPTSLQYIALPIVVALFFVAKNNTHPTQARAILVTIIILLSTSLVFFFLMLTWNTLSGGVQNLSGFQERYLLPLLPCLALIFKSSKRESIQ